MNNRLILGFALALTLATQLPAQQKVDSRNTYARIFCVVGWTGTGTFDDA